MKIEKIKHIYHNRLVENGNVILRPRQGNFPCSMPSGQLTWRFADGQGQFADGQGRFADLLIC
jgi:hypothetical protein